MSASSGIFDLQIGHEPVDNLGGRFEGRLDQPGVDHGGLGIGVAEDLLNDAQIHSPFQKMGGVRVTKRMDRGSFVDTGLGQCLLEGYLDARHGQGLVRGCFSPSAATGSREEPMRIAMGLPELSEEFDSPLRQGDVAVLVALTADVEEHAVAAISGICRVLPSVSRKPQE